MGVGGQRQAPAALPRERPGTRCTGGWVGPRACLDRCGNSRLHRDSIPGPSSPYESLHRLRYSGPFSKQFLSQLTKHFLHTVLPKTF
jgi:hypothetical protein